MPRLNTRVVTAAKLVAILLLFGVSVFGQNGFTNIAFTVSMPRPHTHLFEIDVSIKREGLVAVPAEELLVMPVWTPGSYLVREFERHVQDFAATDATGQQLKWEKINKNTWRVVTNRSRDWRATYKVYANELSVRTSELNSSHAYWNNANLLMYLEGFLTSPSTVRVVAPDVWKVATGLPGVPGQRNTFRAENFDVLYDSPFEVSNFKSILFNVKGVPHRIVIDGEGNYDPERMRRDVQKIVETQIELMGGEIPYRDYTFILHLRPNASGGLEHANSTSLGYSPFGFTALPGDRATSASPNAPQQTPEYRGFLSLVSHEFFHVWNVKRIRPDALGPFDYTKENYTKLLWVAEGITSYYENLILRRAGLITDKEFLSAFAASVQSFQRRPGRREMSAEEASYETWIKYYRQDENSVNSQVDYYDKGAILGLLLDLEIRRLSKGTKSLDDVMRHLYTEFYKKDRNYTPSDFQKVSELMAGASLEDFFAKYVRGREELDCSASLAAAGWGLGTTGVSGTQIPVVKACMGADPIQEGARLVVSWVYASSPA